MELFWRYIPIKFQKKYVEFWREKKQCDDMEVFVGDFTEL